MGLEIVIWINKKHSSAVIDWLDSTVSPNLPGTIPDCEKTPDSRLNPYYLSTAAQVAHWQGSDNSWEVKQWGHKPNVQVNCREPRHEVYIAMKWS